jgi:DNA/RNA endonuclease G (NUC1)
MINLISPNIKILFNPVLKTPMSVEYIIDPLKKLKGGRRSFIYDPRISQEYQMSPKSILRGYSRGHLAPSYVMSWDINVWRESYRMTNVAVQNLRFNVCSWNYLERGIYKFAKDKKIKLNIKTGISEEGKILEGYFIPDYFYTIINSDYEKVKYIGENNDMGKIWKK